MTCPECGSKNVDRDEVDIGVGTQCGPWACFDCGWTEYGVVRCGDCGEDIRIGHRDGCIQEHLKR